MAEPNTGCPVTSATAVPGSPHCELGESARWSGDAWWWVDVGSGTIYTASHTGQEWRIRPWLRLPGRVSLAEPVPGGKILIAYRHTLQLRAIDRPDLVSDLVADLDLPAGWVLNDGTVDPTGDTWIGVVGPRGSETLGWLARVRRGGRIDRAVPDVETSNGLTFDADQSLLYHADSYRRVVWAHRLTDAGDVASSEEFIRFDANDGMPDGLCADDAGGLWVAVYGRGEVRRYDRSGRLTQAVTIPTEQSTSVALGGTNDTELIITSAREGFDHAREASDRVAGVTFHAVLAPDPRA